MSSFVKLLSEVMTVEAHGHLLGSGLHFKRWFELLLSEVDDAEEKKDVVECEEAQIQRRAASDVGPKGMRYVQAPRTHNSDPY